MESSAGTAAGRMYQNRVCVFQRPPVSFRRMCRAAPLQGLSALSRRGCAAAPDWAQPCPCPWRATKSALPGSSAAAACTGTGSASERKIARMRAPTLQLALWQQAQCTAMQRQAAFAGCGAPQEGFSEASALPEEVRRPHPYPATAMYVSAASQVPLYSIWPPAASNPPPQPQCPFPAT